MIRKIILPILFFSLISCNNQKIDDINKEINDIKLKNQELEFKIDKLLNKLPESKDIQDIKLYDKNDSEQVKILKLYLSATKWEDRLKYVIDPEKVKPLMKSQYEGENAYTPLKSFTVNESKELEKDWIEISATIAYKAGFRSGASYTQKYYLNFLNNQYKIDWIASTGYNETSFRSFETQKIAEPTKFKVSTILSDIDSSILPKDSYFSVSLDDSSMSESAFIDKNSEDGKKLFDILKDGEKHDVTLFLKYVNKDSYEEILIDKFVKEGWFKE